MCSPVPRGVQGGLIALLACILGAHAQAAEKRLWDHDNLFAWTVAPFDARDRTPEERAQMLARLGFRNYAYSWRDKHIPTFDAELQALRANGIRLIGWNLLNYEIDEAPAKAALAAFKRHGVHPQLWIRQSLRVEKTPPGLDAFLPKGFRIPQTDAEEDALPDPARAQLRAAKAQWLRRNFPKTPAEQRLRVVQEAARIRHIAAVAATYGCKIAFYNHGEWFGMIENQLAIIERLQQLGVTDVGIVYNFSHARDEIHDDTRSFAALWRKMQPHVVAVNVTGLYWEGRLVYPSQGDSELEMMRIIETSGWRGPIGVIAENGGDAEVTLRNYIIGLDWLAAELAQPGSGGLRPFPAVPADTLARVKAGE